MLKRMGKKPAVLILLALLFGCPPPVKAGELTFKPFVHLREIYDDNILFTRVQQKDDLIFRLKPGLNLDYRTERLSLTTDLSGEAIRYADYNEFDSNNYALQAGGDYKIGTRMTLSGSVGYEKDSTQETQLEETGLLSFISERRRSSLSAGLSGQISELSEAGCSLSHTSTEYDFVGNVDYTSDRLNFSYSRKLKTMKDVLYVQPYYGRVESDVSRVDNYGLSFGWSHAFTEKYSFTAYGGARYTETEYHLLQSRQVFDPTNPPTFISLITEEIQQQQESWGGVADLSLNFTGETFSARSGYTRDLSYSASGDPIERDKLFVELTKTLSRRFYARLNADISRTSRENTNNDEDIIQGSISPSIAYRLTQNHRLSLRYSYSRYNNQNLATDRTWDRNRIWLLLAFNFPQKYSPNQF